MIRIHGALKAGTFPNASRLAADLEVSTKTIHRDIDFMRDRLGLPIDFDPVRNGYLYTESVDAFPSVQISEGELFALMVAEKALQQYRGTPFEHRLMAALKKLEQGLPETVSLNLAEWDRSISFRTTAEPLIDAPVLGALAAATQKREQLTLHYRKPGSRTPEQRIVDPYHLANVNGDWYLFAFDHLRGAIRTFVPARIQQAVPTGKTFERPKRFELEKELRGSFGIFSGKGRFKVVLRFDSTVADYIREKRWHPSQKLVELPQGGVEMRLEIGSLVEIQRWILGWAGHAVVLEPRELVEAVGAAASRMAAQHPHRAT